MVNPRAEEMFRRDFACQSAGIRLDEVDVGYAQLRMTVARSMLNGHGVAHGGYLFLLADAAFAYAANSHGPVTVAQHATVSFFQPVDVGDVLLAQARQRSRQGRSGIYDVTVSRMGEESADPQMVAEFRGQSMMLSGNPFADRHKPADDRA